MRARWESVVGRGGKGEKYLGSVATMRGELRRAHIENSVMYSVFVMPGHILL